MVDWKKTAIIGGVAVAGIGLAYALSQQPASAGPFSLNVLMSEGGEVQGGFPSRYEPYEFAESTQIHLGPAVAFPGYIFDGWYDVTNRKVSANPEIDVIVNRLNMVRMAIFLPEGAGPVIPTSLDVTRVSAVSKYLIQVWKTGYIGPPISSYDYFRLGIRHDRRNLSFQDDYVEFKLQDINGNGAANEEIALWTHYEDETYPEFAKFQLSLDGEDFHWTWDGNPLIGKTDASGRIRVWIRHYWLPPNPDSDYGVVGSYAGSYGQVRATKKIFYGGWVNVHPVKNNLAAVGAILHDQWWWLFEYQNGTPTTPVLANITLPHIVYAYWVPDPGLAAMANVVGQTFLPPTQELEIYTGDYSPKEV